MKFDFVIGNPPFQDNTVGENETYAPPVYDKFLESAYKISNKVEMIHPARFLFKGGGTQSSWNKKMLNDTHLKILYYEEFSKKIFANKDIKGGIVISYRDTYKKFGPIKIFTKYEILNSIIHKLINLNFESISSLVISRTAYRLTPKVHDDYPEAINQLSHGHPYDMATNIFDRLPQIFYDEKPKDNYEYIQILGRQNNKRVYKFIRRDYVNSVKNLNKFKLFISKANGTGNFGEILTLPELCGPGIGSTESFVGIGLFDSNIENTNALKYVKSKFARAMLGVLKITQDITPDKWKYVPLQDFTSQSDIDWSQSIANIDQQLYKKYNLSDEEIRFIEENVKEME